MAKPISYKEAKALANDPRSCIELVTIKTTADLSYKYIGAVKQGIKETLDNELNLYCQSLEGVMLCYGNIRLCNKMGTLISSQPVMHLTVMIDFAVFRPKIGSTLVGMVNKVSANHIGLLVHGRFNCSIRQPSDHSAAISLGQKLLIRVHKLYTLQEGVTCIIGSYIGPSDEPGEETESSFPSGITEEATMGHAVTAVAPAKSKKRKRSQAFNSDQEVSASNSVGALVPSSGDSQESGIGQSLDSVDAEADTEVTSHKSKKMKLRDSAKLEDSMASACLDSEPAAAEVSFATPKSSKKHKKHKDRSQDYTVFSSVSSAVYDGSDSGISDAPSTSRPPKSRKRKLEPEDVVANSPGSASQGKRLKMDEQFTEAKLQLSVGESEGNEKRKDKKHKKHKKQKSDLDISNIDLSLVNESILSQDSIFSTPTVDSLEGNEKRKSKKHKKHKKQKSDMDVSDIDLNLLNESILSQDSIFTTPSTETLDSAFVTSGSSKKKKKKAKREVDA